MVQKRNILEKKFHFKVIFTKLFESHFYFLAGNLLYTYIVYHIVSK